MHYTAVVFLAVACAAVYGTSSDYPKPRRSYEIEEEKRSSRRALPPSYALRHPFRPARPTYSQPDPLYSDKYNQSRADAQPEPSNNIADISTLYRPSHHPYRTHPYDTGQYYQQPEPIIEIIVKESNETLPAPLAPPTQPPTKEPVHVFYIKYKKNPNPSKEGGDEVIYEPPVPAITPPPGLVEEHVATPAPYEATSPPPPPLRTTTLRTVIRPDSEVYHGSGLKVTFGGPAIHQGLTGSDLSAAGDSAEVSAASHHSKRQQPYDPRQFGPLPPPNDYSPFSQHSGHLPPQPAPPPSGIRGTDFFRPSPQRQFVPKTPFPDRIREPPLPTPGQIEVYRQEKERLHQENLRRQALRQPHLPDGQPTFGQVRTAQPAPSRQQLQYFRPPQPYRTPQHQYHQEPQYRPLPFPVTSSPLSVYPSLTTSITIPHGSHTGAQGAIPFGNPPVNRGFLLPSSQSNHSAGPDLGYNGPEIVKSISQSEEHSGIPISGSPTPHSYVTPKSQNNFEYTPRPPQYTTTKSPDISRAPTYAPTEGRPPVTQSTTESTVTEPANKSEKESESDKKKSAANLAALPEEVPADLREQLLSSGILGNADIQILDYDKVGDIPIENLPPEALENLYGAGSAPVPSVVRPADPVQMKVVRYDPNTEEGHAIADAYVREDATHLDPVVLNDSRYNRYLPLKVSGNQFPIPEAPQLEGRIVNSVVVLAPVDYDLVDPPTPDRQQERSAKGVQVQAVRFIAGEPLKNLVKNPSSENYNKWFDKERETPPERQSVVLLVTSEANSRDNSTEIFMYDIGSKKVSKLRGDLSSTFVDVAESNSANGDLDGLPGLETVPDNRNSTRSDDMETAASEILYSTHPHQSVIISKGYSRTAANTQISV